MQQFVVALSQRLKISKLVVAEKMVTRELDMMVARLAPQVVSHGLRRCADQVEAMQSQPKVDASKKKPRQGGVSGLLRFRLGEPLGGF